MMASLPRRKAFTWAAFWKLETILKSLSISLDQIRLFIKHHLCDCALGRESREVSVNMENKINAFAPWVIDTSCYRILLNTKRLDCVSNARIHVMPNTQPLIN